MQEHHQAILSDFHSKFMIGNNVIKRILIDDDNVHVLGNSYSSNLETIDFAILVPQRLLYQKQNLESLSNFFSSSQSLKTVNVEFTIDKEIGTDISILNEMKNFFVILSLSRTLQNVNFTIKCSEDLRVTDIVTMLRKAMRELFDRNIKINGFTIDTVVRDFTAFRDTTRVIQSDDAENVNHGKTFAKFLVL
jgi:hypothetical protein